MEISTRPSPGPRIAVRFSRQDGGIELSPAAFRDSYVATVNAQARLPLEEWQGQSLAACYGMARELLGPVAAVALAGEALKALADPQALDDLDAGMRAKLQADKPAGTTSGGESGVYLAPDSTAGYGASTSRSVIMPEGFGPILGQPAGAFIVGHEQGHVRHQDVLAGYGRSYLCSKLGPGDQAAVAPVLAELNRQAELLADREGLAYALAQGHAPGPLQVGVEKFLGLCEAEESDSHPGRQRRLENVARTLGGLAAQTAPCQQQEHSDQSQ